MVIGAPSSGDIVIHNTDVITEKTINILLEILDKHIEGESGLANIMFRTDGHPRTKDQELTSWMFFPDSRSAVCNINDCIELAIDEALSDREDASCLNIWGGVWLNIISNFFHEVHHAMSWDVDRDRFLDKDERMREETLAEAYAQEMIEVIAKCMDIEPEFSEGVNEMIAVAIASKVESILNDEEATEKEMLWCEKVEYMENHKIMFYATKEENESDEPLHLETMKEFLHMTSDDAEDDKSWGMDTAIGVKVGLEQAPDESIAAVGEIVEKIPTSAVKVEVPVVEAQVEDNVAPFDVDDGPEYEDISEEEEAPAIVIQGRDAAPITQTIVQTTQPVVAGAQAHVAPVTQAAAPVTVAAKMYPALAFDDAKFQAIVKSIYMKIANHVFQTCGFNPSAQPFFTQKAKIVELIPLNPEELMVAKAMDCYDGKGVYSKGVQITNGLSGIFIDKAQELVGYHLYICLQDGTQIIRRLVPQNPWKMKYGTQEYSQTALDAQQGNQILWILDPNTKEKQYCARMYNGVLQSNIGGVWVAA